MKEERLQLASMRIKEIISEDVIKGEFGIYFNTLGNFLVQMLELYEDIPAKEWTKISPRELKEQNHHLFEDVVTRNYAHSYGNPTYSVKRLGCEYGQLLSFLYAELFNLIVYSYEHDIDRFVIRLELFLEIYYSFYACQEEKQELPKFEEVKEIIYWFMSDYSETEMEKRIQSSLNPNNQFAVDIIMNNDLNDISYLYRFGEYITNNEIKTAEFLNSLSEEMIRKIADTFTEGYRIGFINSNKDITKKKVVNIRYSLGFERVIKQAICNFKKMGLSPSIYRASTSAFAKYGAKRIGYYGAIPNKQFDFDHKEDEALWLDKQFINRKLELVKENYEQQKEWADLYGGPAVVEVFGEKPFEPVNKPEALQLSENQQKLSVELRSKSGQITNEYVKGEETSFTIIAFPIPVIGDNFPEIFEEIIKINTLDYHLYEGLQQKIIDVLDLGVYVVVEGMNGNRTNLKVALKPLRNSLKETNFENCVADVNIPVGEVFTTPQLKGSNGILHVTSVYLNELKFNDLEIQFEDGKIKYYSCKNFVEEAANQKYMKDNILHHHDTLPLGEFAIGTNTTAYMVARKYHLEDKLPILIAEKMGPHFAVGDTCYSHSEDNIVYNPDGKEIIAKDNEISLLRKEDMTKAYFNCHTDITIPYDELGKLSVMTKENREIIIIEKGRFLLKGLEKLNEPFDVI